MGTQIKFNCFTKLEMTPFSAIHPSTRIKGSDSTILKGKRIVLGVTGSVAAFLSPKIARELIRHGAEIISVMSKDGQKMIGKDLMWWATGIEPITEITGNLEHISLAGVMNEPADLMLIAPSTTNTVAKLASGIADTPVSLIASSLQGKGVPLMVLCVAHEDLINSPRIKSALAVLKNEGITIINPIREEGKAKVPEIGDIVFEVMSKIIPNRLKGKYLIVTGGPTREFIDNVRFISNSSSGKMGIEIAKQAKINGANVNLLLGPTHLTPPRLINTETHISTQNIVDRTIELLSKNPKSVVILSSAMGDFKIKNLKTGKIKSGHDFSLDLEPTTKLSDIVKRDYPESTLVLFKAEWDVTIEELATSAKKKLDHCNADFIIANDLARPGAGFNTITNHVILMAKTGSYTEVSGSKFDIARLIIEQIT